MADIAYELVEREDRLGHVANEILDAPVIELDIENTGHIPGDKDSHGVPWRDEIRLVQVNTGKQIYVIDLFKTRTPGPIMRAIEESKGVKVIHNAKHEQKWLLYKHNVEIWPLFDTYRASAILYNGLGYSHDLYSVYERELGEAPPTEDLGGSDWSGVLTKKQYDYAASDVTRLARLRDKLKPKLATAGLNGTALIEFGAVLPESAVELNGFPLDSKMWLALADENARKAEELRKRLIWELPNPTKQMTLFGIEPGINLDSTHQMLASLRQLGLEQQCPECRGKRVTREGGECSFCSGIGVVPLQNTQEMTLAMFAAEHPMVGRLLEYRKYSKHVSSFGPEYLRWIDKTTGRIHCEYFPFTGAGRYAASKPNLQNPPRDPRFRACFRALIAGRGFTLADLSNIELRLIAEISRDPVLTEVFLRDGDAHKATASILLGILEDAVTKEQRQQAKPVNFGFCLAPGTEIVTASGSKRIEDVRVGDSVLTHMGRWRPVVETQVAYAEALFEIRTVSGKVVKCTPDHGWLMYDKTRDQPFAWAKASELRVGDRLDDMCATSVDAERIVSISVIPYVGKVYDITVEEDHSFIANGLTTRNCYGMQAAKLVLYALSDYGVALTLRQAEEFRRKYFAKYVGIKKWHERVFEEGPKSRMSKTLGGRIRHLGEDAYNEHTNTPSQGSGADILKYALRSIYFRLKKISPWNGIVKMIHHVHDEVITETPEDEEIRRTVEGELIGGLNEGGQRYMKTVPCKSEAGSGPSWASKK